MTVAQLIERLKELPPELPVLYQCCSDWEEMEAAQVQLVRSEEKRVAVVRDRYRMWYSHHAADTGMTFVSAVVFPGN